MERFYEPKKKKQFHLQAQAYITADDPYIQQGLICGTAKTDHRPTNICRKARLLVQQEISQKVRKCIEVNALI